LHLPPTFGIQSRGERKARIRSRLRRFVFEIPQQHVHAAQVGAELVPGQARTSQLFIDLGYYVPIDIAGEHQTRNKILILRPSREATPAKALFDVSDFMKHRDEQ